MIRHSAIKKIIEQKIKSHQEFTAMIFRVDSKDVYINVVDESFINSYCSSLSKGSTMSKWVDLDGYEIDLQDNVEFSRMYLIEKVHLKPEM